MKRWIVVLCAIGLILLTACAQERGCYQIVLISMDQTDQYWNNIDEGCRRAAEELGNVDYKWYAPETKDSARQIEIINNAVADGADAILLAATSADALNDSLAEAHAAGIKIVYLDSPAGFSPVVATFATDNYAAGRTAGETMLRVLAEKGIAEGTIGIVGVDMTVTSAMDRERGFRDVVADSGFLVLDTQYCEGDFSRSKDAASGLIADGCIGLFGTNEGSTVGVGNAIQEYSGDVVGIGFDNSSNIMALLDQGALSATMVQEPATMGYEGLKAAVLALEGDSRTNYVEDTGVTVLSAESMWS